MRYFDKIKIGIDEPHLDKLDNKSSATIWQKLNSISTQCFYLFQEFTITTKGFNNNEI